MTGSCIQDKSGFFTLKGKKNHYFGDRMMNGCRRLREHLTAGTYPRAHKRNKERKEAPGGARPAASTARLGGEGGEGQAGNSAPREGLPGRGQGPARRGAANRPICTTWEGTRGGRALGSPDPGPRAPKARASRLRVAVAGPGASLGQGSPEKQAGGPQVPRSGARHPPRASPRRPARPASRPRRTRAFPLLRPPPEIWGCARGDAGVRGPLTLSGGGNCS